MGSYNSFLRPVAEGEITDYKSFFWFFVRLNRRDIGPDVPISRYVWDEEHEQGEVQEKRDELQALLDRTPEEWDKAYEEFVERAKNTSYHEELGRETERICALKGDLARIINFGVPDALKAHHEHHMKMFQEAVDYNAKIRGYRSEEVRPLREFQELVIETAERMVAYAEKRYSERRKRVEELNEFLNAAVEMYGEPSVGIIPKSSSAMW